MALILFAVKKEFMHFIGVTLTLPVLGIKISASLAFSVAVCSSAQSSSGFWQTSGLGLERQNYILGISSSCK